MKAMLVGLLPVVMAGEYNACGRPDAVWASWDQGNGRSVAYGAIQSGDDIYILGDARGNLSLATKHKVGTYTDHNGVQPDHHTVDSITIHHDSKTCCGGTCCDGGQPAATTQIGMDMVIYKLTKDGAPVSVFAVDTMPVDGITNGISNKDPAAGGSVNGGSGGFSIFGAIDTFEKSGNPTHLVIAGRHRGRLSFPQADGSLLHFDNAKFGERANGWGYNAVVVKIDIASNALAWVTSDGMMLEVERSSAEVVATTAEGHVVAAGEKQGDAGGQFIVKFNGADGTLVWSKTYSELDHLFGMDSVGEMVYVTGEFKSTGTEAFATATNGLGNLSSSCSSASVLALDASGADGPAFTWMAQIGCGAGQSVRVERPSAPGDYLYISGDLNEEATTVTTTPAPAGGQGSCTLTGKFGGYLAKIRMADGMCVWAKDTPKTLRAVSDGTSVWAANSGDGAVIYDATHAVTPNGASSEEDMFVAKYSAADGTAQWATAVGGVGRERLYDLAMTSKGPMAVGYSNSASFSMGDIEIHNLQHDQHGKEENEIADHWGMFAVMLSASDATPPCITACPAGDFMDASTTFTANTCYADNVCIADGAASPSRACFKCESSKSQTGLTGPITGPGTDHCYFDGICIPKRTGAPWYHIGNSDSVCEQCDPDVKHDGWSIKPGYFHDRDFALNLDGGMGSPAARGGSCTGCPVLLYNSLNLADEVPAWLPDEQSRANKYGIRFVANTGGCQVLPDLPMPAYPNSNLNAALVNPTSGTIAAVGARLTSAIAMIKGANNANQGAEIAATWYSANPVTCTRVVDFCPAAVGEACVQSEICAHTPAAHADLTAPLFGTSLHYGHSNARIKVMQALAILHNDIASGTTTATRAHLEMDVIAHMLIPMYQGAIQAAHKIDHPTTAAAGLADFAAYWTIIKHEVAFNAVDQARLDTLAAESNNLATNNFCTVKTLLHRNLPDGSKLQYMHDWTPCPEGFPRLPCPGAFETAHANEVTGAQHLKTSVVDESVHLTEADLGLLQEALVDGQPPSCGVTVTNCGIENIYTAPPQRVVTMNHGATEFMLAMGLQDHMAGTANLADEIWPRYKDVYDKIPVLSSSYPTDETIVGVNADFVFGSWRSAFREYEPPRVSTEDTSGSKGTWSNMTVPPCSGINSDYFPAGENTTTSYSTCRPQLHARGIGTWLEPTSCEDPSLRMPGKEETIYWAIDRIGEIFNVPHVASQLKAEMRNDFNIAKQTLLKSGHSLNAVWLDCITCCGGKDSDEVFVGSGGGGPQVIMQESGLVNLFKDRENSWACVKIDEIIAASPDVVIIVETTWDGDSAQDKINFLHNRSALLCNAPFVKNADYIKIPFSASTPGPRNGVAALDMVAAAMHVTTGEATMNFESGVDFFDPLHLANHTKGLLCPVQLENVAYAHTSYTSCGVTHSLTGGVPQRVVTMTQGVTEMMLAMGLEDKMVGTAYLDDAIWPRYETAYKAIDVLSETYPTEEQITAVNADFLLANFMSAFRQKGDSKGLFTEATVGRTCEGEGSDFWATGSNTVADGCELGAAAPDPCSTCRPQLHAVGIGTWLDPTSCEDKAFRPQGGATEETVYAAIRQIGKIFNVAGVAEQLVSEIRNDFIIASNIVKDLGKPLRAVWLDCVTCCEENELFVGAGSGAPNLVMEASGLTNIFAEVDDSFSCQSISTILAADPDVMVVVDAQWDPALGKIDFMHNHTDFCGARFVQEADYISIPFSASSLGPRNGAAALDMASAAVHVTTGASMTSFRSGVTFFDPYQLASHTTSLKCPLVLENVAYANASRALPERQSKSSNELPDWGIALVVVFGLLFFVFFACALTMFLRERAGKPIFKTLEEPKQEMAASKTNDVKVAVEA